MKRLRALFVATIVVPSLLLGGIALAAVGYIGWPCTEVDHGKGYGSPAVGLVSRTQRIAQYRVGVNRFSAECRTDAQGVITLASDASEAVVRAALMRESDPLARTYYFYGLDRPLTGAEKQQIEQDLAALLGRVSPILQIPLWIEGLGIAYNLGCPTGNPGNALHLTSAALSGMMSGVVTSWNDPLVFASNPRLESCDRSVRVAVRSDVSQQTMTLKDYLAKRNPQWASYRQERLNTQWPTTLLAPCRGRGDGGMAACVAGQPGSIGYVGFAEAKRQGLALAHVQNASGAFVAPSIADFTRAAEVGAYPRDASGDWSATSLTDGPVGYPVTSLQFGLAFRIMVNAYQGQVSPQQVRSVVDYFTTLLEDGTQSRLRRYGLAPLAADLLDTARRGAAAIQYLE